MREELAVLIALLLARADREAMVAVWIPGRTKDGLVEAKSNVVLRATRIQRAWAIDTLNGTPQELNVTSTGAGSLLPMLIKDHPVFLRLSLAAESTRK